MKQVRIGIIGMGIGEANAIAFANNPKSLVVALCARSHPKMQALAAKLPNPVKLYTDYQALIKDPEVDAVFIGSPNQLHAPMTIAAACNDKHVLLTKPLADSQEKAVEMTKAAESSGIVNMMSLSTRFSAPVQYLGHLSHQQQLGEIYYARARSIRRSGIPDWNLEFIQKGGGAFRDMGVHVLDAAWWMMGMPEPIAITGVAGAKFGPYGKGYWDFRVPTEEHYKQYDSDDYGSGFVRFANGAAMQVESFWASHQPDELQIELFGDKAGACLYPVTLYSTTDNTPHQEIIPITENNVWQSMAEHFLDCILQNTPCQAPLRHGLIIQNILEGLLESARTRREVLLSRE